MAFESIFNINNDINESVKSNSTAYLFFGMNGHAVYRSCRFNVKTIALSFIFLTLSLLFILLQNGVYLENITLPNLQVKKLYIKWNEKLN